MKVATLQYCYSFPESFQAYSKKITTLVAQLSNEGIQLILFPEYAGFEMASIENRQTKIPAYLDLFQRLSHQYQVYSASTGKL
jgi:predicted amidohydrolase